MDTALVYSVAEAAKVLGVSVNLIYKELKTNPDFPRKMVGGRVLIPAKRLEEYVNNI